MAASHHCFTLRTCVTSTPGAPQKTSGSISSLTACPQMAGDFARALRSTGHSNGAYRALLPHDKVSRSAACQSPPHPDHIPARRTIAANLLQIGQSTPETMCIWIPTSFSRYFCITASAAGRSLCQIPVFAVFRPRCWFSGCGRDQAEDSPLQPDAMPGET